MPFIKSSLRTLGLIVLGLAFIAAPMAAFKLGLRPLLDDALSGHPELSFVVGPLGMLIAMTAGYWLYVRLFERRAATELAPRPAQAAIGIASGAGLIGGAMLVLFAAGYYHVLSYAGFGGILSVVPTILTAAVLEELAFRGVVFGNLERQFGTTYALLGQSLIFGAVHMSNAGFTTAIDLAAVFMIGALWTLLYVMWRNIWSIAFHHAAWNLTIVASGLPLSGIEDFRQASVLRSDFDSSRLLTGGDAGPESSLLAVALVCIVTAGVWWLARRRGATRSLTALS